MINEIMEVIEETYEGKKLDFLTIKHNILNLKEVTYDAVSKILIRECEFNGVCVSEYYEADEEIERIISEHKEFFVDMRVRNKYKEWSFQINDETIDLGTLTDKQKKDIASQLKGIAIFLEAN